MRSAEHDSEVVQVAPGATAAASEVELPAPIVQAIATEDAAHVAKLVRSYRGDPAPIMSHLQRTRGNAFVQAVLTAPDGESARTPSLWERMKGLETDGSTKLLDLSASAAPKAQPIASDSVSGTATPAMSLSSIGSTSKSVSGHYGARDKSVDGKLGKASANTKLVSGDGNAEGSVKGGVEGLALAGSAGGTAELLGTQVAIHSKPVSYELFGEQVSAQFHVGVDAKMFAEAKGDIGLDVGWSNLGARAKLTGAGSGAVTLSGAATLAWAKKSPAEYAQRIVQHGAWRSVLAGLVPNWVLGSLTDARVQSWLQDLMEIVISGGGGDAVVLGASTSATARGSLGLPQLAFAGGGLKTAGGVGLAFDGANLGIDLQLGRTHGMELLSVLAFKGANSLFKQLAPALPIPAFLQERLGATTADAGHDPDAAKEEGEASADAKPSKLSAFKDRARKLDGSHTLLDVQRSPNAGTREALTTGEGHDFTFTRERGKQGTLRTGDDARKHDSDHQEQQKATAAQATEGKSSKVKQLAAKALGSAEHTVAAGRSTYSKKILDERSTDIGSKDGALHGQVKGSALHVNTQVAGEVGVSAERLRVGGNAGASAYLVAGSVQLETPELGFDLFGERVTGQFNFGMDAGAFAEANGNINVDVGWKGAGLAADVSGFVGAKAGLSAAGTIKWARQSPKHYADLMIASGAWKSMFGTMLPSWALRSVPDKRLTAWIEKMVGYLINGSGDALVLGARARAEGSAGIGAAGAFSAGFRGGVLHCHGRGGITFGLGAGAHVDLALGVADGMSLLAILALRGSTQLFNALAPPMDLQAFFRPKLQQMLSPG